MRRIISVLMCLILCVSVFGTTGVVSFASDVQARGELSAEDAKALFGAIGIDDESVTDMTAPATRAMFITGLMRLMNLNSPIAENSSFSDVESSTELASATNFAVALGILSPATSFYPNAPVEYAAACKMTVEALGRGVEAQNYGGYPHGYVRIADSAKLIDGMSGSANLTVADMYVMLANLASTGVYSTVSYSYEEGFLNYRLKEGKTFLEAYHKITIVEGIVDAANGGYLYDSKTLLEEGCVSVDNTIYTIADDLKCSLGKRVKAYVKNTGKARNEIIYASDSENDVTVVSYLNDPVYSNGKLSYTNDSGKEKTVRSADTKAILYNGRAFEKCKDSDFSIKSGYIEIIDNNGDGVADVYSIWESAHLEIGYINKFDGEIYDENYCTNVILSDDDVFYESNVDISEFSSGTVLEVYISKDGRYVKIQRLDNTVSGVVSGVDDDAIYLDDVRYLTTPYFKNYYAKNLSLGSKVSVVLDSYDAVVAVKSYGRSAYKLAYYDAIMKKKDISSDIILKLFTQEGKVIEGVLKDKIKLNSRTVSADEAYNELNDEAGNIIRYQTDSQGLIVSLITISDEEGIYDATVDGYNALKRYRFAGDDSSGTIYYKIFGYFVPHFIIDTSTTIFCVSENESDDEKRFSIAAGLDFIANDSKVVCNTLKPYNVNDSGCAEVLLYKAADITSSSSLGESASFGVVTECSEIINDAGDEVFRVLLYNKDVFTVYYIEKDEKFIADMQLNDGEVPYACGDIIRYLYSGSYIKNAVKDFDGKSRKLLNLSGDNTECHYYYGKLYSVGPSSVAIRTVDGNIVYVKTTIGNVCMIDEKDVYTASKDRVSTYKQIGEDACDILIKCRYSGAQETVIFK